MAGSNSLSIEKRVKFKHDFFDINGEISYEDGEYLEGYVLEHLSAKTAGVVLNLVGVAFINSSALSLLLKLNHTLLARGVPMYILNANNAVEGIFEMTRVKHYFQFLKNEQALVDREKKADLEALLETDEPI